MKWDAWLRRRRWERRMDAEMRFHLDCQVEDYISQGLSRGEAERRARREFGAVDLAKDECRDQRPLEWLGQFWHDGRLACRSLARSRGFAAAAALTVALGIGAVTAIFSVVYAVLLKPLPYAHPERIYSVEIVIPERRTQFASLPPAVQVYLEWRKSHPQFSDVAALTPWECSLTGDGEPERLGGARVSANFFSFLGVRMVRGRAFTAAEERPGSERVVILSDALWRRRFGADPAVVGRKIDLNGQSHIVVGIAPPGLLVPTGTELHPQLSFAPRVDIWKPVAPTEGELQNESWDHGLLVRLQPGGNAERGRQQLQVSLNAYVQSQVPGIKTELIPRLVPIREIYSGKVRLRLLLLLAASALLLLVACVNAANLFLARAASRGGEFATRIALGAGRARILSQTLSETIVLSAAGGLLGAVIAEFGARWLAANGPDDVRQLAGVHLNPAAFGLAAAASLATGILCGVFPAWQACRGDAAAGLRESARHAFGGGRATRVRQVLVGVEMTLGTALVASAGLLLHSFVNVLGANRGYQVDHVLAVDMALSGAHYDGPSRRALFYRQLTETVRGIPGVEAAGAINDLPAGAGALAAGPTRAIFLPSDTNFEAVVLKRPVAVIRSVTPGYFAASGTALRAGRFFTENEAAPVAMVSESLARRLWPGAPPAAATVLALRQGGISAPISVVGVVEDVRSGSGDQPLPPMLYRPYTQWDSDTMALVVRTANPPAALAPAVRAAIRKMDASLPIPAVRSLREIVGDAVSERRFLMMLTALFAATALLLGAMGVYGVVSYAVACRTRDIGLRIALGALRGDVMRWVIYQGMRPVAAGLAFGIGGAVAAASGLRSLLFGITPADPWSLGAVALVLLAASGLACYLPARRAAGLDPAVALRHE